MQQPTVYRGRRDQGWLVLACSVPFLMFGAAIVLVSTLSALALTGVSGMCGAFIAVCGFAVLRTRVTVGPDGISKTPSIPSGFTISWDKVEKWSVTDLGEDRDTFSSRAVRFSVGWRKMEVREAEVFHPGFDQFVQDVRAWAGEREVAPQ